MGWGSGGWGSLPWGAGDDVGAPYLIGLNPAPFDFDIDLDTNIAFTVTDDESQVDLATLNVQIQIGAGPLVDAIIAGVIVAPFDGVGASIGANGLGYDVVLDPTSDFPDGAVITVYVQAADIGGALLDTSYYFTTLYDTYAVVVDAEYVQRDGGYEVQIRSVGVGTGAIPDGTYYVHLGPAGDETDPRCYSGISGQGEQVIFVDGIALIYTPPLPVGGPYAFTLRRVQGTAEAVQATNAVVTSVPEYFRSGTLRLRQLLGPRYNAGLREIERLEFPQT